MLTYIGKRILVFLPTLFVITLLGFIIAINAPGDPVEKMVSAASSSGELGKQSISQQEQKLFWRKKLGLDLPVFYFSISSLAAPDTLYRVYDKNENTALNRLLDKYGNWNEISNYNLACTQFYDLVIATSVDTAGLSEQQQNKLYDEIVQLKFEVQALKSAFTTEAIEAKFTTIKQIIEKNVSLNKLQTSYTNLTASYQKIKSNSSVWKNYIPAINFYGFKNQYHRWLFGDGEFSKGIVRFDFGISYVSKQPVGEIISTKITWSLFFSLCSVFLAYIISIPIGVRSAQKRGGAFDRTSSLIIFMLYSLPAFFVAFLLMLLFANPNVLSILPSSGVKPVEGYPEGASFFECARLSLPYIILPLICYTYSSFAFLSRTIRGSMLEVLEQDYIRTARAKGLSDNKVIWKHAFKNSLFPLITIFANIFPVAIGGSVILETIFTIPGMGLELYNAIAAQNYPIIIAVMTLTGILTLIGFLVSDILYVLVDPRVRLK
ncbi:MAG: ABC transporter permease [Bacteroidetes bacterium]|nr:ABC transporter permease [Bacteroidota bacterium]